MNLPTIDSLDLNGKRVLVRGDLDVDIKEGEEPKRLETLVNTLYKILEKNPSQIILCGHRGRPTGYDDSLSLKPLVEYFVRKLAKDEKDIQFISYEEFEKDLGSLAPMLFIENLRFWEGEEKNDDAFAKKLAAYGDIYINDAFGSSHRDHASIVGVPKLLPHAAGIQFSAEVEHLSRVLENPARPLVFIISGVKEDKAKYVDVFKDIADKVLVGGRLPEFFGDEYNEPKVQLARLMPDKEDITMHYIEHFEGEVRRAKTVVISGPIGKFEDEGHDQGTKRVFNAVAESDCYSVAGGGDTESALELFNVKDKIDWVSTGGGAMLEFLAKGTLPGIEVLIP